jgi:hypothetical protein
MKSIILSFSQPARRVYTATKKAIERCGQFKRIECNDQTFTITARHGMGLLSFGENITIHVVATSTETSEVRIESVSRIFLNPLNFGANKKNVQSLEDYIRNEVYKLCSDEEIKLTQHRDSCRFSENVYLCSM